MTTLTAWLDDLSRDEALVMLASLTHTVQDIDLMLDDALDAIADSLSKDLDVWMNQRKASPLVEKVPLEQRRLMWASLWASHLNVHAPQDGLSEAEWQFAEDLFAALNDMDFSEPKLPRV